MLYTTVVYQTESVSALQGCLAIIKQTPLISVLGIEVWPNNKRWVFYSISLIPRFPRSLSNNNKLNKYCFWSLFFKLTDWVKYYV